MSPSSRTTFRIEASDSALRMFKQPEFVSQYFIGETGKGYWEDFVGESRLVRLENKMALLEDEEPELPQQEHKRITFVELDEEEAQAETEKAHVLFVEEEVPAPEVREPISEFHVQETAEEPARQEMSAPVQLQEVPAAMQAAPIIVQAAPADDTAQQLAAILGNFSFDALRSEIDHRFEELRRDLAEKAAVSAAAPAVPAEPAESAGPEVPAAVTFQIETAKIPVPGQEIAPMQEAAPAQSSEPADKKPDYSSMIMPEADEDTDDSDQGASGGIDIMALLAAQAKKMENISPIEMMEVYGEDVSEVTLEELEKYINKNY
jgi:hypothetical protein